MSYWNCIKALTPILIRSRKDLDKIWNFINGNTLYGLFKTTYASKCIISVAFWLLCNSHIKKNKINRLYEKRLRLICKGKQSSFYEWWFCLNTWTKLRFPCNKHVWYDETWNRYELWNRTDFTIRAVSTVCYGRESLTYSGPKSRETLPSDLKQTKLLSEFKAKFKKRNPKIVNADIAIHTCKVSVLFELDI